MPVEGQISIPSDGTGAQETSVDRERVEGKKRAVPIASGVMDTAAECSVGRGSKEARGFAC